MTAATLVAELQARGVELAVEGDQLRYRPVSALTPEDVERLRAAKPEVVRLLEAQAWRDRLTRLSVLVAGRVVYLNPETARGVLSDGSDHDLASLKFDIAQAVACYQAGIRAGVLPSRLLVRGLPLAMWLSLDDVAALLRGDE